MPSTFTTIALQTAARAACVSLLEDYASDASIKLQVYRARPSSIFPPTAFIDLIRETTIYRGPTLRYRTVICECVVIHGLFDYGDAVDQKDAFVDGLMDWSLDRYHEAGGETILGIVATEDIPNYVPDWLPPEKQRTYYASRIDVEVEAGG